MTPFTLRCGTRLVNFSSPVVMGILNVTPDSFAVHCSSCTEADISVSVAQMKQQGVDIIDIGAYSTRPNADFVSVDEEWNRLQVALKTIRATWQDTIISVDTWRAEIAKRAVEEYGADIINDVSGGQWDKDMFDVVAQKKVPYVLTHTYWLTPQQQKADIAHDIVADVLHFLQEQTNRLHQMGVADVILDSGFGLGKTAEESYRLLNNLQVFTVLHCPVLAGLSRKSMLYKPLGITPMEALNATTAANVLALTNGADILRVHDVEAAKQTIEIVKLTHRQ